MEGTVHYEASGSGLSRINHPGISPTEPVESSVLSAESWGEQSEDRTGGFENPFHQFIKALGNHICSDSTQYLDKRIHG
jgi:hypothetical protein